VWRQLVVVVITRLVARLVAKLDCAVLRWLTCSKFNAKSFKT
jgi:hypothetical protein